MVSMESASRRERATSLRPGARVPAPLRAALAYFIAVGDEGADPEADHRTRTALIFNVALLIWIPPVFALYLGAGALRTATGVALSGLVGVAIPAVARRSRIPALGGHLVAFNVMEALLASTLFTGGIDSPMPPAFALVPVSAVLTVGALGSAVWAVLSAGAIGGLYAAHLAGWTFPQEIPPEALSGLRSFILIGLVVALATLAAVHEHRRQTNLRRLAARERDLAEAVARNQDIADDLRLTNASLREEAAERERVQRELQRAQATLVQRSREAGMAEAAIGILHNVGNALNCFTVASDLLRGHIAGLRVDRFVEATERLGAGGDETTGDREPADERTRGLLVRYLRELALHQNEVLRALRDEVGGLARGAEHMNAIIQTQQSMAGSLGMIESLRPARLVDLVLEIEGPALAAAGIEVTREDGALLPRALDRHQMMQVLLNVVSNARHALVASSRPDRRLVVRTQGGADGGVRFEVADNGSGILPEHLPRVFEHGFTTKPDGHGVGLHYCASVASAMGATISCESAGPGQGAVFRLDLPPDAGV